MSLWFVGLRYTWAIKEKKIKHEPKLCKTVTLLQALFLSNNCHQVGGEFQPKTSINMQLLPF